MRYFIISDDGGNPIYYDHPDGRMLSLILVNTHIMMKENLGQRFKSITCGHTLFVFQKYEKLSYLVVSDQGESEMFLRSLLRQIFEHMVMVFGRQAIEEGKYTTFSRHRLTIQHIIDTLCALSDRQQSLLVRATERLEVDDRTRGECFKALKNALKQEPLATHGLLFVGTKLLATYSKNKAPDIDPSDMLLLINDFRATFHPYEREVEETSIPAADYSQVSGTLSTQESGERDRDEGFVSASEDLNWDEEGKFTQDHIRLLSTDLCDSLYDKVCLRLKEQEKQKEVQQRKKEREKINQASDAFRRLFVSTDEVTDGKPAYLNLNPSTASADEDEDNTIRRKKKKNIRRKSQKTLNGGSGEWQAEQQEKELDKRKQESERDETVETAKDVLIADFMDSLERGDFKIGLQGDSVLLLQEMLHLISFFPGALDGGFGEKSALSVSAFQEASRISVTGILDLLTVKLLLEQVMPYFKKAARRSSKKRVAFLEDEGSGAPLRAKDGAQIQMEEGPEAQDEGRDEGEGGKSGQSNEDDDELLHENITIQGSSKVDESEPENDSPNERRPSDSTDGDDEADVLPDKQQYLRPRSPRIRARPRPLILSRPIDTLAMLSHGREDSSSSDEAGFASPLVSPHSVVPPRSLKAEIENEKLRQEEAHVKQASLLVVAAQEEEKVEGNEGSPKKEGDSRDNGVEGAGKRERNPMAESGEDVGLSQDDIEQDYPFPELDFNLRQPFDPENSTSYKQLYLRTPKYMPRWVYYAELERMTTLVIITSNHPTTGAKGQPAERERLNEIRNRLRAMIRNYATYLITKEHTHLPVVSFLHQFPGLVHFIFVDRTFNRVIAPPITSVHGPLYTPKSEEALHMKLILRSKVWDMCYKAQQHLSEGHHAMTMKSGIFQYSYRLWVEDMEGFELPFNQEQQFIAQRGPQTHKFYKKLVEYIFPSRSGLRCYELYTLYLGVLSVKSITHYDRNLVAILLDRKNNK